MSFETRIIAFSERFLSDRTFELIVAPALADMQFDPGAGRFARARNHVAVLRAVVGGLRDELSRDSATFALLTLLTAGYYSALLVVFWGFFDARGGRFFTIMLVTVLSLAPVMACFWPERHRARSID